MVPIKEALTFDDVTLAPKYSEILPSEVSTGVQLAKNLKLKIILYLRMQLLFLVSIIWISIIWIFFPCGILVLWLDCGLLLQILRIFSFNGHFCVRN